MINDIERYNFWNLEINHKVSFQEMARLGAEKISEQPIISLEGKKKQFLKLKNNKTKQMEREIEFGEIFDQMCQTFQEIKYANGDISDVGNEVGYALGKVLPNLTEDEIKTFIIGIKHGISLTNGTH